MSGPTTVEEPVEHWAAIGAGPPRVGHYELRDCLGSGGFGQVFEAWDAKLCRMVAIKRLKTAGSPARLVEEARLAASLQHPAFVKIFALEEDRDTQSIVMELVPGHTLRDLVAQQALGQARVVDIIDQIACAMAQAHTSGLIHGDLKPSNLMVEPSGTIRILDFGLARQIDPLATQSALTPDPQGTIAYMAPERLLGRAPDRSSDIYSLGVIFYELLTGARPFAALNGLALAAAQMQSCSDMWSFPGEIAQPTVELVRAMTARDLARRPESMQEVLAHIRGAAASPVRAPERPTGGRERWRAVLLGLFAAIAAGLAGTAANRFVPLEPVMRSLSPFSEAQAMQAGLEGLRFSDRENALDAAIANFTRILEHRPHHAPAAAGLSIAYSFHYAGDGRDEAWLKRAEASAQEALQANDQLALAHAARAWALAFRGQPAAALVAAERALTLDPFNQFALHVKTSVLLRLQRFSDAGKAIATASAHYPNERIFADLRGTLLYQQGDYRGAEQAFRHSLRLEPNAVFAYANLSAALLRLNRGDEALQVLQLGLQIAPSGMLYTNLGTTLFARGDYADAAKAFEHAVSAAKGGPNDYLKWANLADTLRWIPGREAESRRAYLRATQLLAPLLERAPEDATFMSRMGLYRAHLEHPETGLPWTGRAVAAAPNNPDIAFRAALASELAGNRDAALAHLIRAKALGYPSALVDSEPDLVALRRDPRFQTLTLESANQ